jgi:hypothetical protein
MMKVLAHVQVDLRSHYMYVHVYICSIVVERLIKMIW